MGSPWLASHRKTTTPHDKTMSLDTYTRYIPLHKAANFWGNYVSALKVTETLPPAYPGFGHEFGKLENLQWRGRRGASVEPTRVLPDANDRITSLGYNYLPVHTEIYGSYRNRDARSVARF